MRITEIANAQAQLELWKLVNDSVWTAIQTQAQQQKRAEAERKAQAKLKPRVRKPTKAPYASPPPPLRSALANSSNTSLQALSRNHARNSQL